MNVVAEAVERKYVAYSQLSCWSVENGLGLWGFRVSSAIRISHTILGEQIPAEKLHG